MEQRDLIWVKFPFSNLEDSKIRPAIIVSNNSYNSKKQDVLICAITSNLGDEAYSVFIDKIDLVSGALDFKSKIRGDKLILVDKKLIIKSFAKLNEKKFDLLTNEIMGLFKR